MSSKHGARLPITEAEGLGHLVVRKKFGQLRPEWPVILPAPGGPHFTRVLPTIVVRHLRDLWGLGKSDLWAHAVLSLALLS